MMTPPKTFICFWSIFHIFPKVKILLETNSELKKGAKLTFKKLDSLKVGLK